MKNQRIIKNNYEFQSIINKKNVKQSKSYIAYYVPNDQNNGLKYGISVGKKLGNAILRNKVKRQTRHMINELLPKYENLNFKIIIIVRKNFLSNNYEINLKNLEYILKNLKNEK
ncbi:ribonuclease P protein component [Mesoplasma lactucae]|uniref:Ribonuclease P protein component n=1 Tax=Mesoplasma lactucae ATCC 49193 TaxID=81460 RepID=A0A291ISD7_9MOLU|nr:ribonuclease P protein component [Mesoplasma lactucae]ATG97709.1 ribonuclease P protein component [Mesoplasma lactucae ATCC 49193]